MKTFYNTNDNFYLDRDLKSAFTHALNLGRSDWMGTAEQALQEWRNEYMQNTTKPIDLPAILKAVSSVTGVQEYSILVDVRRYSSFVLARHLIRWFAYHYTTESMYSIRDYMGDGNHSSVIHSRNYIDGQIQINKQMRLTVDSVKSRLSYDGYLVQMVRRKSVEPNKVEVV